MPLDTHDDELTRHSYYEATAPRGSVLPALQGSHSCDAAIVGGGLAGLSAALELASRGMSVRVLEARHIGWGASGRNGGQAIHGFACDQAVLEAQLGASAARQAWDLSIAALDLLRRRIREHHMACDWQDGFLSLATSPRKAQALQVWADGVEERYGYPLQRIAANEVSRWIASPRFHGGVFDARSGHLHPLRYTQGVARAAQQAGAHIHEDSPVIAIQQGPTVQLSTRDGHVRARQVLLAGNVYLQDLVPALQRRIMPVGTYIACTEKLPAAQWKALIPSAAAVCDTNFVLDYFRPTPDHRVLYGGRVSYSTLAPSHLAESMRQRLLLSFPQLRPARIDYAWGGFVDISMNRAPDFGRLPSDGAHAANVYYLQGFSGHGLALTGMAGQLVAEAMNGDASRFDLFSRIQHRNFPGGPWLRTPALVLGMAWYRMKDLLA